MTLAPDTTIARDPHDRRLALRATGLLRTFNEADVLTAADVHVATRLGVPACPPGLPGSHPGRACVGRGRQGVLVPGQHAGYRSGVAGQKSLTPIPLTWQAVRLRTS